MLCKKLKVYAFACGVVFYVRVGRRGRIRIGIRTERKYVET